MKIEIQIVDAGVDIKCPNCKDLNQEYGSVPDHFECNKCGKKYSIHPYIQAECNEQD